MSFNFTLINCLIVVLHIFFPAHKCFVLQVSINDEGLSEQIAILFGPVYIDQSFSFVLNFFLHRNFSIKCCLSFFAILLDVSKPDEIKVLLYKSFRPRFCSYGTRSFFIDRTSFVLPAHTSFSRP